MWRALRRSTFPVMVLFLTAVTSASAQSASADLLRAKNTGARTVMIGERVFHVTPQTLIRDEKGDAIRFADLDAPESVEGEAPSDLGAHLVRYEAVERGGLLVLRSLELAEQRD